MERHTVIIPARAGSKSIKNKNLIKFGGKTLVRMAVEAARDSKIFSQIIVTSDYPRIKLGIEDVSRTAHTEIMYLPRPDKLATDDALMIDVVKSVLKDIGCKDTWVWVLQPTSPFRIQEDFKVIHKALSSGEYEAAISFKPSKDYIDRTYTWKNGIAHRLNQSNYKNKQDLKQQVTRSGNYYVVKRQYIEENKDSSRFTWEIKPYFCRMMGGIDPTTAALHEMKRSRTLGINIDDWEDLIIAKTCVERGDVKV